MKKTLALLWTLSIKLLHFGLKQKCKNFFLYKHQRKCVSTNLEISIF